MRIRCPSCLATYEVAAELLETPRVVRCARCARDWTAEPLIEPEIPVILARPAPAAVESISAGSNAEVSFPEPPAPDPVPEPEPEPVPARVAATGITKERPPLSAIERLAASSKEPATPARGGWLLTSAWAASVLILLGLGAAGYVKRDELMRQWPASIRVYAMIGLASGDMVRDGKTTPGPVPFVKPSN